MSLTGGLPWHWRAWRSQALWAPACADIADWLAQLQPRSKKLILLGPSAGWMLPTPWLLRFSCIHAVDLDPRAAWLFGRRHGAALQAAGVRCHYQTGDALAELPRLLTVYPQACVLFDNLLGQLRFNAPRWQDPVLFTAQQIAELKCQLQGREWGSVHDLLSGPARGLAARQSYPAARNGRPDQISGQFADQTQGQPPSRLLAHALDTAWLAAARPHGEWLDHLTEQVFPPGTAVRDIAWAFSPRYWHWLQAGWVQAAPL